jgi:tRNA-specific 2-thiouridylase
VETQYGKEFLMPHFHYITDNPWKDRGNEPINVTFKIRHTPEFTRGTMVKEGDGYRLFSEQKLQGIAPGQFGVIYDEDHRICVGSGEIGI